MSEEPNKSEEEPSEPSGPEVPAAVEHDKGDPGSGDFTTELDPTFIPDSTGETPDEKRAREHPEETGS
ncbi:hypothetical protein [Paenarthrobacter nitroguajacolicus]|uniref:hypothetical protein n=1 Tax=Paenarthrobacter nitroguajacolicus TaxID=211146 RepID=UPI00248B257B|nr:hypothetical protein [Paenarthrobacter nitroguajacolicus]MDI2037339.1 hypothetical protein [Paenarthrobacter nitroguajacolicus]